MTERLIWRAFRTLLSQRKSDNMSLRAARILTKLCLAAVNVAAIQGELNHLGSLWCIATASRVLNRKILPQLRVFEYNINKTVIYNGKEVLCRLHHEKWQRESSGSPAACVIHPDAFPDELFGVSSRRCLSDLSFNDLCLQFPNVCARQRHGHLPMKSNSPAVEQSGSD